MKVSQAGNPSVPNAGISGSKATSRGAAVQGAKTAEKTSASKELVKASPQGVNAEISPKSREFSQVKSIAIEAPDIREDKIVELKNRISQGTYKVDSDSIADRMVDDHLRMPGGLE